MPFSSMTTLNGATTVTLDASGYNWPARGYRRADLSDVQYARVHYEGLANTAGAQLQVWIRATTIDPGTGVYGPADWLPAGPWVANAAKVTVGDWQPIPDIFPGVEDVLLQTVFYGTPSASVTVYWTDLQVM